MRVVLAALVALGAVCASGASAQLIVSANGQFTSETTGSITTPVSSGFGTYLVTSLPILADGYEATQVSGAAGESRVVQSASGGFDIVGFTLGTANTSSFDIHTFFNPTAFPNSAANFDFGPGTLVGTNAVFNVAGLPGTSFELTVGNVQYNGFLQFFSASVPEASTWTMMLIGFGAIGAALRRRPVRRSRALAG